MELYSIYINTLYFLCKQEKKKVKNTKQENPLTECRFSHSKWSRTKRGIEKDIV